MNEVSPPVFSSSAVEQNDIYHQLCENLILVKCLEQGIAYDKNSMTDNCLSSYRKTVSPIHRDYFFIFHSPQFPYVLQYKFYWY